MDHTAANDKERKTPAIVKSFFFIKQLGQSRKNRKRNGMKERAKGGELENEV